MTYETVAAYSQVASLLIFIAMFIAVLGYVYWPRNREGFERAAREALDLNKDDMPGAGKK